MKVKELCQKTNKLKKSITFMQRKGKGLSKTRNGKVDIIRHYWDNF